MAPQPKACETPFAVPLVRMALAARAKNLWNEGFGKCCEAKKRGTFLRCLRQGDTGRLSGLGGRAKQSAGPLERNHFVRKLCACVARDSDPPDIIGKKSCELLFAASGPYLLNVIRSV